MMILSTLMVSKIAKMTGYETAQRYEGHMYQHFYLLLFEGLSFQLPDIHFR